MKFLPLLHMGNCKLQREQLPWRRMQYPNASSFDFKTNPKFFPALKVMQASTVIFHE